MSKTIDKIRKLLNLAANEAASANEADVARGLAEKLMEAHGISDADLEFADAKAEASTVDSECVPLADKAANIIAAAIGRITGCTAFSSRAFTSYRYRCMGCDEFDGVHEHVRDVEPGSRREHTLNWVGSLAQREHAIQLHGWIMRQLERLTAGARPTAMRDARPLRWLAQYRLGVAIAVAENAVRIVQSRPRVAPTGNALAVRDEVARAIAAILAGKKIRNSTTRARRSAALDAGFNDGRSVGLQGSVNASSARRLGSG